MTTVLMLVVAFVFAFVALWAAIGVLIILANGWILGRAGSILGVAVYGGIGLAAGLITYLALQTAFSG